MKYQAIIPVILSSLCGLSSMSLYAFDNQPYTMDDNARWFEVEVILFKQVSAKDSVSETFTSEDLSRKKPDSLDLLAPYLQPDLTTLKQHLPNCEEQDSAQMFAINTVPVSFWQEDNSSKNINELITLQQAINQSIANSNEITSKQESHDTDSEIIHKVIKEQALGTNGYNELSADISSKETIQQPQTPPYVFVDIPAYNQYPISSDSPLCIIPKSILTKYLTADELIAFNIDAFPVKELTGRINGQEQWRDDEDGNITWASEQPYLISQDSLKLKSINHRIKRSRDYKPLLHLGWRQKGESKRKSKAVNLYAGEHYSFEHNKALQAYEGSLQAIELQNILDERIQSKLKRLQASINEETSVSSVASTQLSNTQDSKGIEFSETLAATSQSIAYTTPKLEESNKDVDELTQQALTQQTLTLQELAQEQRLQAKQQQLDLIFQEFEMLNQSTPSPNKVSPVSTDEQSTALDIQQSQLSEQQIKTIVEQLSNDIDTEYSAVDESDNLENKSAMLSVKEPVLPVQAWFLDGLFKIHLDHYIYINSEMNIFDKSLVNNKQSLTELTRSKPENEKDSVISFKQHRRVITGEIHYFDHPHIGMVVQVRRFDPTKPASEAVTQSIKN